MLRTEEQQEIVRMAKQLAGVLMQLKVRHKKGEMSTRSYAQATERAEQRLRDFLKEVG